MSLLVLVNNESDLNMIGECIVYYQLIICEYFFLLIIQYYAPALFIYLYLFIYFSLINRIHTRMY